jgi:hypothetical protein
MLQSLRDQQKEFELDCEDQREETPEQWRKHLAAVRIQHAFRLV